MSGLIDTIDLMGEEATQDAILNGSLTKFRDSKIASVGLHSLSNATSLEFADFDTLSNIAIYGFYNSPLKHLLLRSTDKLCTLNGSWNVWGANAPITKGTGYIYVPSSMVDRYKSSTNWSAYANQIRALEDYTVDGTITGELDETKI